MAWHELLSIKIDFPQLWFLGQPQTFIWAMLTATANSNTEYPHCLCGKNHFGALSGLALQRELAAFKIYVLSYQQESGTETQKIQKNEDSPPHPQERNRNVKKCLQCDKSTAFRFLFHPENSPSLRWSVVSITRRLSGLTPSSPTPTAVSSEPCS